MFLLCRLATKENLYYSTKTPIIIAVHIYAVKGRKQTSDDERNGNVETRGIAERAKPAER